MNKKGVELAVNSIVIIILAIVVLAVLAIGFATGWGQMWDKLETLGGSDMEVATDACALSCEKSNKYAFCTEEREALGLKTAGAARIPKTCNDLLDCVQNNIDLCTGQEVVPVTTG